MQRGALDWHQAGVWEKLHQLLLVELHADRGYDHDKYRRMVRATGVKPAVARRGVAHGSGLGTHRWVIEQAVALLHLFRRLRIRWEIRDDLHEAFMTLAAAIICWRRLTRWTFC